MYNLPPRLRRQTIDQKYIWTGHNTKRQSHGRGRLLLAVCCERRRRRQASCAHTVTGTVGERAMLYRTSVCPCLYFSFFSPHPSPLATRLCLPFNVNPFPVFQFFPHLPNFSSLPSPALRIWDSRLGSSPILSTLFPFLRLPENENRPEEGSSRVGVETWWNPVGWQMGSFCDREQVRYCLLSPTATGISSFALCLSDADSSSWDLHSILQRNSPILVAVVVPIDGDSSDPLSSYLRLWDSRTPISPCICGCRQPLNCCRNEIPSCFRQWWFRSQI